MEMRSVFDNISPLDHRYSISEKNVFDNLGKYLSENASIEACIRCEIALIIAHLKVRNIYTEEKRILLEKAAASLSCEDVYKEEEKTHHHIRALVNVLKTKLSDELKPFVHLGATSADILDTSQSWRIKNATQNVVLPLLSKLQLALCDFAEKEASTPQVGRTHGQHAVPITLGFAISEYVSRLGKSILEIKRLYTTLKGKLAGAVGSYNATSMIVKDPLELENLYLSELGLEPSEHSTQLVEPEYLLRLLLEFNSSFGIIANLADDLRCLARSEIAELKEGFSLTQVGSSTMPQKRNPWNSEHVKSMWKAFMPRIITFCMDQISEHQRDLSNSASGRFIADYICGFAMAVERMYTIVIGLKADNEKLLANLVSGGGMIMAEPAYILLCEAGVSDAHEIIRRITLKCEKEELSFVDALQGELNILPKISKKMAELGIIDKDSEILAMDFFKKPENYCGLSCEKAKTIAKKYRKLVELV
ncbi:MAG: lyase family protein [Termitinemataceae bacterium]|nr:MAG: lyase family protein [Termitinemataceae bacterium]